MEQTFFIPRVEDYFSSYNAGEPWQSPGPIANVEFNAERSALVVRLLPDASGTTRLILIEIPHPRVFRIRFDPRVSTLDEYPDENTRTIVMDRMAELRAVVGRPVVQLNRQTDSEGTVENWEAVVTNGDNPELRLLIARAQFELTVFRPDGAGGWFPVLQDDPPGILFRPVVEYKVENTTRREYQVLRRIRKPATARYLGFGEKVGADIVKNGKQLTYVNYDNWAMSKWYGNGPFEDREPLYNSNPFFLEYNGSEPRRSLFGVLVDNTGPLYMDIAATLANTIQVGTLYDDLDLYHFFGPDTKLILTLLTEFVGRARLKPRYVLGYHQGCYGYANRPDIEYVADKYRDYAIPIDGLHIDIDIQDRLRTFTVNQAEGAFPRAGEMFSKLRECGYKCSTNITPFIRDDGEDNTVYEEGRALGAFIREQRSTAGINPHPPEGDLFRGGVPYDSRPRGVYPALGQRKVRDWWGRQYHHLLSLGLEMVWQDMTTPCMDAAHFADWSSFPLHLLLTNDERKKYRDDDDQEALTTLTPAVLARNLYAYNLVKATYHGLNFAPERQDRRNFIIARGGFTGMHRFAALWTGDNVPDWPYLRLNILQSLAGGISGQPITGADIGGFGDPSGTWADPELIIRWTIAGAFLPWFRNHYTRKSKRERFQEPWAYFEMRNDIRIPDAERWLYELTLIACRHYINLRYRLLQLFYDAMFENTLHGLPIVRPLFVNDDHDPNLFYDKRRFLNDEWFVGRDLLIAPVIEKQSAQNNWGRRPVYLPQGSSWYCFMNNVRPLAEAVAGGRQIEYDAHLSLDSGHLDFLCPIYVRAGAILPTIELEQYVGQISDNGRPANPITINIYPVPNPGIGATTTYNLYEDDGVSRASAFRPLDNDAERTGTDPLAANQHRHTVISHSFTSAGTRHIRLDRQHDGYTPAVGYLFIALLHDPGEPVGGVGGSPLDQLTHDSAALAPLTGGTAEQLANKLADSATTAWYYHPGLHISFIKLVDPQSLETFVATYLPA